MIIKLFLKAKHWQIFILMFGAPILFSFINLNSIINPINTIISIDVFISMILFMGWFYSIGVGLHKLLPKEVDLNLNKFKFFIFFPLIYIMILILWRPLNELIKIDFGLTIPFHLFSMFCMFYVMYFCSKTIKSIEMNKEVTFSDYSSEFFLFWFYIIGIWILQPKINKIYSEKIISTINFETEV